MRGRQFTRVVLPLAFAPTPTTATTGLLPPDYPPEAPRAVQKPRKPRRLVAQPVMLPEQP